MASPAPDAPSATTIVESEAKKASKDAGIYTYSRVAGSLFVLLALALGARLYSTAEFAYISALLLLYESSVALGSLGLADAVFYLIGRNPERAHLVVRQTSFLLLLVSIPVIAVVWLVGAGMEREIPLGPALPWLALTILIELPTQPAVNQLLAVGRARLASALYVGFAAFRPIAVLLPTLVGIDITWIPVMLAVAGMTRLFAHTRIVRGVFPMPVGQSVRAWLDRPTLKAIVWFALPAGVAVLGGKLSPQIDKYVVQMVRGNADFVLYTAGAWELPLVTLVPYAIGAVMQARYVRLFASGQDAELRTLWHQTVRKTALIVVPLSMMVIGLAREAVIVVAGERYADAAPLFQLFTLTMLQRVASYGSMLQSIGETRSLLVTSTLMLVTNLVLSYPFTIAFGFTGAAIATVCASVPGLLFSLRRISLGMKTNLRGVMPWRFYGATLALSTAVAVAIWILNQALPYSAGPRLAIGAGAYLTMFFILGRGLRLISDDDVAFLRQWITLRMLRKS
jgi:O-antigen/teichoic acid export membrane protein